MCRITDAISVQQPWNIVNIESSNLYKLLKTGHMSTWPGLKLLSNVLYGVLSVCYLVVCLQMKLDESQHLENDILGDENISA